MKQMPGNDHAVASYSTICGDDPTTELPPPRRQLDPHRSLRFALIVSAIDDLEIEARAPDSPRARELGRRVRRWIDGYEAPIPWEHACVVLGIDPYSARSALERRYPAPADEHRATEGVMA